MPTADRLKPPLQGTTLQRILTEGQLSFFYGRTPLQEV